MKKRTSTRVKVYGNAPKTKKKRLCSGWRVFPNGDKCKGCEDCKKSR